MKTLIVVWYDEIEAVRLLHAKVTGHHLLNYLYNEFEQITQQWGSGLQATVCWFSGGDTEPDKMTQYTWDGQGWGFTYSNSR